MWTMIFHLSKKMLEAFICMFLKNKGKLKRIWDGFVLATIIFVIVNHFKGIYFPTSDLDEAKPVDASNIEDSRELNDDSGNKEEVDELPQIIYHDGYATCLVKLPINGLSKDPFSLEFDFPDTWTAEYDKIAPEEDFYEIIRIRNTRGVEIYYTYFNAYPFSYGDKKSPFIKEWKSKALSDTELEITLEPLDGESFVVTELILGDVWRIGFEEPWSSGGDICYAVLPKDSGTDIGDRPIVCNSDVGRLDCSMCMIPVDLEKQHKGLAFYSCSPDGTYTDDEKEEVISILKSLKRKE